MKKIMVVDDEADTIYLVRSILEAEGFEVVGVGSGIECLERLDAEKPDAVLLDIMMPDMDGWETYHKIKKDFPDMPVSILSAKGQKFDQMLGLNVLKADDYIIKPFGAADLVSRIKSLFREA
ncbi:response regulator transcription factor [Methanococcoides methylutens]|uniref:DNA-binding response regulator KdpE n=1 Tax=Methanococcoides methylutens MM1 TaxID=1434104 RepID=A0A0E3SPW5_METMT|nr:response regulator [Methanococcoides methylutens]AKB84636.1 DNA-binding response regulator KdpE [Methanococcoides methylutens MM1]